MNTFGLAPLLLIFPVIGVLFNGLVGRRFVEADRKTGEMWSGWFASVMALSAFAVAVSLFFNLQSHEYHAEPILLFDWFNIPSAGFYIPWAIQVDTLSVTMMLVVTGVGSLIHIYAIGYMHGDPNFSRFFTYLNLFLFFMLILVVGNNYLMLFVGWEGVGLCSFLLIGFWFDRVDEKGQAMNANAARKAFVANRVGDFAVILAMILLFWTFKTLEFERIFTQAVEMVNEKGAFGLEVPVILSAVTFLFLIGAAGKSAQIPLYVWLPDAMAGPTPVSALIHAATMVTSGIYLLVRSNVFLEIVRAEKIYLIGTISSPDLIAYTGAATAFFAGLIAFTQFDIKKVLAYSTVSQLGFMIAAVGMGAYVAAMFHLVTHAFFKALLFLGSGSVIHGMEHGHHHVSHGHHNHHDHFDPQDMRTMGGLRKKMPVTYATYMIGALALAGIFPLAGFWSKDEILSHAFGGEGNPGNLVVLVVLLIAAGCTAFYMGRQIKMVFFDEPRHAAAEHAHESTPVMTRVLVILAILAVVAGLLNMPFLSHAMADANNEHPGGIFLAMEGWLEHSIQAFELSEEEVVHLPHTPVVINYPVAIGSTLLALFALGLATQVVYRNRPKTAEERDPLQSTPIWFWSRLPLNTLYMNYLVPAFNAVAMWLGITLDEKIWHDFFHERLIRDAFLGWTRFVADVLDTQGVDGLLVLGSAKLTRRLADVIRLSQTGYARNYALSVLLGTVALLVYFLFMN